MLVEIIYNSIYIDENMKIFKDAKLKSLACLCLRSVFLRKPHPNHHQSSDYRKVLRSRKSTFFESFLLGFKKLQYARFI